ncbi:MAG: F0F1 ATP synthase subunit delta, partial [Opitutaceae bacterium]
MWLMKHFLFRPILKAIDVREKKIAAELADAAAKKAEAAKDRDDFQKKNEAFDQQRAALLAKATEEAKTEREHLIDEARKAADALSAKRQETLRNDADHLNQTIARRTQLEVFAISRKALADLATTSLEERMGAVFTRRLGEMDGKAKATMGTALKAVTEPAVVRSAFDLPAEERAKIQNAINEAFSVDAHPRFETAPDLIGGIELTANGQKVGWSIGEYLKSLEKGVGELIKQQDKPAPKAAAKSEPKPESKPETTAPAKAAVEAKTEPKPATEPAPKPEVVAKAEPDKDAAAKPDSKPEPKPAADSKSKPEAAAPAKPTSEVKAEPKAATATPPAPDAKANPDKEAAAKPEPKAAPKPDPKAAAEPDAKPEAPVKPTP